MIEKVQRPHSCVAALQQRLCVPQQQPMIWIHHVRLSLGQGCSLGFLLLVVLVVVVLILVGAVEGLLAAPSLLQQRLLQRQWR